MKSRIQEFFRHRKSEIRDFATVCAIVFSFNEFVGQLTICVGPSMEPTFDTAGEIAVIDKFSYLFLRKEFRKGDVVVSICPTDPKRRVCKRIAATENETVFVQHFTPVGVYGSLMTVPPGHVYLRGDNSSNSTDSRSYGPVSTSLLIGKIRWKFNLKLFRIEKIADTAPQSEDRAYELVQEQRIRSIVSASIANSRPEDDSDLISAAAMDPQQMEAGQSAQESRADTPPPPPSPSPATEHNILPSNTQPKLPPEV